MAKIKLRLSKQYQNKIAWDPDTDITWTGDKIFESEVTSFVARAMAKKVLEEVKGKETTENKS